MTPGRGGPGRRARTRKASEGFVEFSSAAEMEGWMERNHRASDGLWLRFYKKGSGVATVGVREALEVALCYGWITGQSRPYDGESWLGRFVPRRPRSIWSKVNVELAERLMREGRMEPAGLAQVEAARQDGRWARAYNPPSRAELPADFLAEVEKREKARAFLKTLNRANVYAIVFRIENAKDERARRAKIESIVAMLDEGRAFH